MLISTGFKVSNSSLRILYNFCVSLENITFLTTSGRSSPKFQFGIGSLMKLGTSELEVIEYISCFSGSPNDKLSFQSIQCSSYGFHSQNFCAIFAERNTKFFFLCASVLREKTTICAIICYSHFAKNCPIPLLRNSSFAQFRNFVKIKRLVTVCFSEFISGKILFWNVFLLVTFT